MPVMNATTNPVAARTTLNYGKLVVIGIFALAAVMAIVGVLLKMQTSSGPLEFWGVDGIQLLQSAPQVELLTLEKGGPATDAETLRCGDQSLVVVNHHDISKAPGLIHHRHFLTESVSLDWKSAAPISGRNWEHALRFRDGDREINIAFDLAARRLANLDKQQEIAMIDRIAENWQRFFDRQAEPTVVREER